MKLPSVDKICNIAGCVLIFVLLALLVSGGNVFCATGKCDEINITN